MTRSQAMPPNSTESIPHVTDYTPNTPVGADDGSAVVEYCGERIRLAVGEQLSIGRDADLVIDDNAFLHRVFLVISHAEGYWFVHNVGSQLGATVADPQGGLEAFLAPGSSLPLVLARTEVVFTAGPTTYEFAVETPNSAYQSPLVQTEPTGETTIGSVRLTTEQRIMIVALAEPRLVNDGRVSINLPSSPQAARRLGWTNSKFNRKLDNVCDKLNKLGVRGLQGDIGSYASNRRTRLVEYAIATRLVTRDDLDSLERYVADRGEDG